MRVERKRMGDMLLAEGAVTAEQIDEALETSKREGIKLGESLVRLSYVTEDTIAQALSNQLKIERVHLAEEFVDFDGRRYGSRLLLEMAPLQRMESGEWLLGIP